MWLARYLSVDTLTRIRSSPMRTFSPSDLCLDAGWIVHQQASPKGTKTEIRWSGGTFWHLSFKDIREGKICRCFTAHTELYFNHIRYLLNLKVNSNWFILVECPLVILYLLNLLAVRHQMTACLSETLMSSNRSSTGEWKMN